MGYFRNRKLSKPTKAILIVLGLLFFTIQVVRWEGFFAQTTLLQTKRLFIGLSPTDLLEFGKICNSLENLECSQEIFGEFSRRLPGNLQGLSNFGIALAKLDKWQQASQIFQRYIKLGGRAYDVMLWQARALNRLEQPAKSLFWYYQSLAYSGYNKGVAIELVDQLVNMNRFEEALSAIAAITSGNPYSVTFWNQKMDHVIALRNIQFQKQSLARVTKVRLPSLETKNFFVPVKSSDQGKVNFFVVDQSQNGISVSEEILSQWQGEHSTGRSVAATPPLEEERRLITLPSLQIGPWEFKDIEVTVCKGCRLRLGRSILSLMDITPEREEKTAFVLLTKR